MILILFSGFSAYSQKGELRKIDREKVEKLREDNDFLYSEEYQIDEDPLERIWNWLVFKFYQLIGKATEAGPIRIIFLIVIAAIVIYAILKLAGIDPSMHLLHRNKEAGYRGKGGVIEEIIGKDFKTLIEKAYKEDDFKEVVRNYYLFALDRMDAAGIISWKKGKTNYEYLDEVKDPFLRNNFSQLNDYFVYAVYGEFEISMGLAREAGNLFDEINSKIK